MLRPARQAEAWLRQTSRLCFGVQDAASTCLWHWKIVLELQHEEKKSFMYRAVLLCGRLSSGDGKVGG